MLKLLPFPLRIGLLIGSFALVFHATACGGGGGKNSIEFTPDNLLIGAHYRLLAASRRLSPTGINQFLSANNIGS